MYPRSRIALPSLPLNEDSAKRLGEGLANDVVIVELIESLERVSSKSALSVWIDNLIVRSVSAVYDELERNLGYRWANETDKQIVSNNPHLLDSFKQELRRIQRMIYTCPELQNVSFSL